jgi:hypothetical protein
LRNSTSFAFSILKVAWKNPNTFPALLYVDANPVLDVLRNRQYGSLIEEYWAELVRRDSMITWSEHTEDEVTDVISIYKYSEYALRNGIQEQTLFGNKIPAYKVAENIVSEADSVAIALSVQNDASDIFKRLRLYVLPIDSVPEDEVSKLTRYIYTNFGGTRKDARHVALANLSGTNDIQSNDVGLLRFPSINVFGASQVLRNEMVANQTPVQFFDFSQYVTEVNSGTTY